MSGSNDLLAQSLLAQVRQRPQRSTQSRLAEQMMQSSMSNAPVFGQGAFLARAGSGVLAGLMSGMADRNEQEREDQQLERITREQNARDAASQARMAALLGGMVPGAPQPPAAAPQAAPEPAAPRPAMASLPMPPTDGPAVAGSEARYGAVPGRPPLGATYREPEWAAGLPPATGRINPNPAALAVPGNSAPAAMPQGQPAAPAANDYRTRALLAAASSDPNIQRLAPTLMAMATAGERTGRTVEMNGPQGPGTYEMLPNGQQRFLGGRMPPQTGPETFDAPVTVNTPNGPVLMRFGNRGGQRPVEGASPNPGYQGNSMDAQHMNVLLNPQSDPNSAAYEAAYLAAYGPRTVQQQDGSIITTQPPVPPNIRRPGSMAQPPAPQPNAPQASASPAASTGAQTVPTGNGGSITTQRPPERALTAGEVTLREETENALASARSAASALRRALELSPTAYAGFAAGARGSIAGQTGLDPATAAATREFTSLMGEQALSQLRAIFGGNPTEGERKILLDLQASTGMSRVERETLLRRAIEAVATREAAAATRLQGVVSGTYGRTQPGYQVPPATPQGGQAPANRPPLSAFGG